MPVSVPFNETAIDPPGSVGDIRPANLVLQGGGTLGIAHVGAIAALEEHGYRFVGLAGTSAGAIVALLIAACRERLEDPCAGEIREILELLPAADFVDGPYHVRRLIKELVPPRRPRWADLRLFPGVILALRTLLRKGGLNSGDAFSDWLEEVLAERGVATLAELKSRVETALGDRFTNLCWHQALAIITTALPMGYKMVFPRHLECLGLDSNVAPPAVMVRASMSIPGFFSPLRLPVRHKEWAEFAVQEAARQLDGEVADEIKELTHIRLVDGGLLSNFPVDSFRANGTEAEANPLAELPTIGISLAPRSVEQIDTWSNGWRAVVGTSLQLVSAARAVRDREARSRLRADDLLIAIDTGDVNWLDFSIDREVMAELYERGYHAANQAVRKTLKTLLKESA